MGTEELKKRAVDSLLNQRIIVWTEPEESFFEKTRDMPVEQYNEEFEKKVTGHMGFSGRPALRRAVGAE